MELNIRRDPTTFDPIFGVWRPDEKVGQLFPDGGRLLEQVAEPGSKPMRSTTTTTQRVGVAILLLLFAGPVVLVVLPFLAWHWYTTRQQGA